MPPSPDVTTFPLLSDLRRELFPLSSMRVGRGGACVVIASGATVSGAMKRGREDFLVFAGEGAPSLYKRERPLQTSQIPSSLFLPDTTASTAPFLFFKARNWKKKPAQPPRPPPSYKLASSFSFFSPSAFSIPQKNSVATRISSLCRRERKIRKRKKKDGEKMFLVIVPFRLVLYLD